MWLNVCDLDKLNNSTPTDKDKELELKGASRSPIENDRMISTLSELIMLKRARRRFWVICHWLWAGDFYFLLPSWCRDSTPGDLWKYYYCLWLHPTQGQWVYSYNKRCSEEDIRQTLRVASTSERVLSTLRSEESKGNVNIFLILLLMSLRIWVDSFEY